MTSGEMAVNSTENYVNCLYKMVPRSTLHQHSSLQFELRNRELSHTKCKLRVIKEIYRLAEIDADIQEYNKKEQNLTDQAESKNEFKLVKDLISLLKESVTKHESALRKVTCVYSLMKSCMTPSFNDSWIYKLLSEEEWKSRIKSKTDTLKRYKDEREAVEIERFFGSYVNPIVYSVIVLVGLVGNGSILLIFAKEKNVRTKPNVMIFNLVVGDTLNLLINVPLHYMVHFSSILGPLTGVSCHLFAMTRFVFFALSALSLVLLSIQRYFITVHIFWRPRTSRKCSVVLYILTVWLLAIFVSLPEAFNVTDKNGVCSSYSPVRRKFVSMLTFVLYCVVCPCTMVVFSVVTARRLRSSTRDVPSQLCSSAMELSRSRSARVLTALTLVFLISYVPAFTWYMVEYWFEDDLKQLPVFVPVSIDNVSYHLLFLNVCCNPMALYILSGTFRKPLIMYMCRCCSKVERNWQNSNQCVSVEGMTQVPNTRSSFLLLMTSECK
jgi:hypothetical protein